MDEELKAQEGTENPTDSPTVETTTEETPSVEGENTQTEETTPFHEHPRFKELIDEKNTLKQELEELRTFRQEVDERFSSFNKKEEEVDIPSWFGGDEHQWQEFNQYFDGLKGKAKQEAIAEIKAKEEEEKKALEEANSYFEKNVEELEASGHKVDRNKLMKFVQDRELIDSKGRWNWKLGQEFLSLQEGSKKPNPELEEKKRLAGATGSNDNAEDTPKNFKTAEDFSRKRLW